MPLNIPSDRGPLHYGQDGLLGVGKENPTVALDVAGAIAMTGALTNSSPTAGIGYSAGAGGAVSQATDRITTVILNTVTGKITTQAASLAALTIATFTVTNSAVAATDSVILSKVSGDVDTHCWVNAVAAGSFDISLRNTHATVADTTAFVLNFAIIKGVIA